jgi:hypothetical protein
MKAPGRILIALLIVLAMLAISGGDATVAQSKGVIKITFDYDLNVQSVEADGKPVVRDSVLKDFIKINAVKATGIGFVRGEPASPAWCSMNIGGISYSWQC